MDKLSIYLEYEDKVRAKTGFKELEATNPIMARHLTTLGGTASAALLGMNKYVSKRDVYEYMTRDPRDIVPDDNMAMAVGRHFEPLIIEWYSENIAHLNAGETLTDISRPWSTVQVDAVDNEENGVEIKTAGSDRKTKWGVREWGKGNTYNPDGSLLKADEQIPSYYYCQVQKQMYIMDNHLSHLCVMFRDTCEFRTYTIKRNDDLIKRIIEAEDDFVFNHLIPRNPPIEEFSVTADVGILNPPALKVKDNGFAIADRDMFKAIVAYCDAKEKEKMFAETASKLGAHIVSRLTHENCDVLGTASGRELAHITCSKRTSFDSKKFKADHPDLWEQYSKSTTTKPILYLKA